MIESAWNEWAFCYIFIKHVEYVGFLPKLSASRARARHIKSQPLATTTPPFSPFACISRAHA